MTEIRDEGHEFVTVYGTVRSTTGETLPGAHVYYMDAAGLPQGTVTGSDGTFSVMVPLGAELYASFVGHGTLVKIVHAPGVMDFSLVPGLDIDEIEIFPDNGAEGANAALAVVVLILLISAATRQNGAL